MGEWDAMEWTEIRVRADLSLGCLGFLQRPLCCYADVAVELGINSLDAVEVRLRDLNRRHDLLFNLFGQLGDRQEAELVSRHTYALRIIGSLNH